MAKRTLSIVLALIMILSVFSMAAADATLIRGTVAIQVGQTCQIGSSDSQGIACFPTNWYSKTPSIVTITFDGYITGVKAGTGMVCFVDSHGVECGMNIIVQGTSSGVSSNAPKCKLNKTKLTLTAGKSYTLKLKNATASKVKWSTSNKKIATVSKGKVKAKKKGTVTITAKYKGKKYKCKVTVKAKPAKKISISKKSATLTVGKTLKLKLKNAKASKVKWSTSNKKIATVSKGKVKAKKKGKATITAKYKNKKYKCKITVKAKAKKKLTADQAYEKVVKYAKKHNVGYSNNGNTFRARISKDKNHNCYITAYTSGSKSLWFGYETYDSRYPELYLVDESVILKHYKPKNENDLISFTSYSLNVLYSQYFKTSQIGSSMAFSFKDQNGDPATVGVGHAKSMYTSSYKKWNSFLKKKVGVSMKDLGFKN